MIKFYWKLRQQPEIVDDNLKQTLNYLAVSGIKLALIINFGENSLKYKRIIL